MAPVSVHDVAAELRRRLPGLGTVKLHKLLYYCQGRHLADLGEPLFSATISAWDMGPVVGELWRAEKDGQIPPTASGRLGEAELNTIGYVVSRYGALSGNDLKHLTHSEGPWRRADALRPPGGRVRIEQDWLTEYFGSEPDDPDDPAVDVQLDRSVVAELLKDAPRQPPPLGIPDDPEQLMARIKAARG